LNEVLTGSGRTNNEKVGSVEVLAVLGWGRGDWEGVEVGVRASIFFF
jgi:hypothetical protein